MKTFNVNLTEYESKLNRFAKIIEKMSKIQWNADTAEQFCQEEGIPTERPFLQITSLSNTFVFLNNFNYSDLQSRVTECINQCERLKVVSDKEYAQYNDAYKTYLNANLEKISRLIDTFFNSLSRSPQAGNYLNNIKNGITNLQNELYSNINELFEHFKYGSKNYVIFGKNGAGKTTLLKQISSSFLSNAIVVPANRTVMQHTGDYVGLHTGYNLNQMLENNCSLMYLTREINNQTLDLYEQGIAKNNVLRTRFYEIFSSLGLDRNITANRESLYLNGDQIPEYSMNDASDGEKSVAYLIMATLLAPQNSFLFIDEPERHLNGALLRNLFDTLETERPDLRFIYLTHIIDFVESRKNVELVYLEKSKAHKQWKFKKIEDYSDISLDVILSIEGTKNDIIFCEGTRNSIDCKILECLFPEYEIQPVQSCEQVKLNVKGINGKEQLFRRKAFGLIDNDYMQATEIDSLKSNNIFAIGYNEWENFLIRSEILEYLNSAYLNKDLTSVKNAVIKHIKKDGKAVILSDFITKRYTKILYATKISYTNNLEQQLDKINNKNKADILREVQELNDKIDSSTDYDKLVSIVPAKMLLNTVAQGIGLHSSDDYVDLMVKHLKQDSNFNVLVKSLLNINFN